jgi:hypothetical protein
VHPKKKVHGVNADEPKAEWVGSCGRELFEGKQAIEIVLRIVMAQWKRLCN